MDAFHEDEITGINITPLVDVVLVLLVIFMVTTNYISSESIKVKLPSASTAETSSNATSLVFTIDKNAKIYLDDKHIAKENLTTEIAAKVAAGGNQIATTIRADQLTPHGEVIDLIDSLRANGITDFAIKVTAKKL